MFDHEEEQLQEFKSELEMLEIPDEQLNVAIQNGITIANKEYQIKKRRQKNTFLSIAVAAILLITFVTSIRVSPVFANAVSSLPGMGKIVEIIVQQDKGIKAIVENDYYEPIKVSQVVNDITLTINGVILDEAGIMISYTLEAPHSLDDLMFVMTNVYNGARVLSPATISFDYPNQEHENRREDVLDIKFLEKQVFETMDFTFVLEIDNAKIPKETKFSLPFTVKKDIKPGKVYAINEEVEIEGQKIIIEEITIYPTRAEIKTHFDEANTMKILHFEDMRIEDENREVWGKIINGTTSMGFGEDEQTFYLQSSYFEQPKKFYLKFNKIQALPKDETYLLVDLDKQIILEEPSIGLIEITGIRDNFIQARVNAEELPFGYTLFSQFTNGKGERIHAEQAYGLSESYSNVTFKENYWIQPLEMEFYAYPNYIEADVSIEIE